MKKLKIFIIGVLICFVTSVGVVLAGDTTEVTLQSSEDSHNTYNSGMLPGSMEFPTVHHPGVGIFTIPKDKDTPSKYSFFKMLGLQSVYTLKEAQNVVGFSKYKSELSNNIMGIRVNLNYVSPNTRVRFIQQEPANQVFVSMGEFNKVSENRFETVLQRAMWTARSVLRVGGDVVYFMTQGIDREIYMKKLDTGTGGERLSTAQSLLRAFLINAFVSGGYSRTRWLEAGWLNTIGGRLFPAKEIRAAWDLYYAGYKASGLYIKDFIESVPNINPEHAKSRSQFNELVDLKCKQKYCLNHLLANPDRPPLKLMTPAELKYFQANKLWKPESELSETKTGGKTKSGKQKKLSKVAGYTAQFTGLAIYFDRNVVTLRKDQKQNAKAFEKFAFKTGKEVAAKGLVYVSAGHCDYTGTEKYNWGKIGPERAELGAKHIITGLKRIKNKAGKRFFTDKQIATMVFAYSGGENNPLTNKPKLEKNTQTERVCILWIAKMQ